MIGLKIGLRTNVWYGAGGMGKLISGRGCIRLALLTSRSRPLNGASTGEKRASECSQEAYSTFWYDRKAFVSLRGMKAYLFGHHGIVQ